MKRTKMKRTKRVLGLALAAVMCMGMLANSDTAYAASGTETSEKVLNIATIGETTTLSPLYMIADNRPTQKLLYEGLVKYVDGEIQPVLAEDWEMSEDGKQLTFYLRQGVTFHDGEPFNAEAAIANIEAWHINPSFTALPGVVNYTNIEAVDEYTIRLTYDTPYFAYINDFCWPDVCTMISPKQITQGDFQTVNGYAGTGPYIYDEYVAGQYTTFVRNENYWGEQPYYDKIVAKYIPDNASRVQALKTGEIDLIYGSAELSYEDYNQAIVGGAGGHLSGGERQRIAIARAMLKDAPIIIFDEATAYLDPENESLIQEAISKLVQGKTLIMVAHRLYTVTGADQLVVVNQGRIEATGTHEELLKKCPLYKEMWQAHIGSRDEGGATA